MEVLIADPASSRSSRRSSSAPLRAVEPRAGADAARGPACSPSSRRASRSKYREIRDTELDHAQGKLSDEEFARQDAELRREAIEILKGIDETRSADPAASE